MRSIEFQPKIDPTDGGTPDGFIVLPFDPENHTPDHIWEEIPGRPPVCHTIVESGSVATHVTLPKTQPSS